MGPGKPGPFSEGLVQVRRGNEVFRLHMSFSQTPAPLVRP
jgi:hypothetical protein